MLLSELEWRETPTYRYARVGTTHTVFFFLEGWVYPEDVGTYEFDQADATIEYRQLDELTAQAVLFHLTNEVTEPPNEGEPK